MHTLTKSHRDAHTLTGQCMHNSRPGMHSLASAALLPFSSSGAAGFPGGALWCGTMPCSINEPVCLTKRTQSVWLGGDSTTNSCCHHRWGITPLYQLPSLIHHTRIHTFVYRWIHPHLCGQLAHIHTTSALHMHMLIPEECVHVSLCVCLFQHPLCILTHIYILTQTDSSLLSSCPPVSATRTSLSFHSRFN